MQYESFKTSKKKIEKLWDKNTKSQTEIKNDIKKIDVDYRSVAHTKSQFTVPLLTNYVIQSDSPFTFVFSFNDFPDSFLEFARVLCIADPTPYDIRQSVNSFFQSFQAGTLKNGDKSFGNGFVNHWWVSVGKKKILYLQANFTAAIATVSEFGFGSSALYGVYKINAKLIIINERNYHAVQSGK